MFRLRLIVSFFLLVGLCIVLHTLSWTVVITLNPTNPILVRVSRREREGRLTARPRPSQRWHPTRGLTDSTRCLAQGIQCTSPHMCNKYLPELLLGYQSHEQLKNLTVHELCEDNTFGINASELERLHGEYVGIEEAIGEYLREYQQQCEREETTEMTSRLNSNIGSSLPLCPCIPVNLAGQLYVNTTAPSVGETLPQLSNVTIGGRWKPEHCVARQRVAVIIPYRDRQAHLDIFLRHTHPILQRQLLDYRVFVVEQATFTFNKGWLMNVGYVESQKLYDFDCVIFHDVDMLMEDDRNFYFCGDQPKHIGRSVDKFDYKIQYLKFLGGVVALRKRHLEAMNGFSNSFYGWGGEDDDFFWRAMSKGYIIARPPLEVTRYKMLRHGRDKGNPVNQQGHMGQHFRPDQYLKDGLNTLQYALRQVEESSYYTWIYVSLVSTIGNEHVPISGA